MLMLSRSRRPWVLGWLLLAPALVLGPGCSSRPENSPVVRKKFQELAAVQDQVADLAVQMKQMTAEVAAMRKDVTNISALNGGGEAVARIDQIDTRMQTLEQEIAKIGEAVNAGAKLKQVASATTSASPAESTSSRETSHGSASSSTSRSSSRAASEPTRTRATSAAASALPVRQVSHVTAPKPRGKYYTIKSGDTPASIAKTQGIKVETLLRANRLPKDATIFPGQKLYVPAAD